MEDPTNAPPASAWFVRTFRHMVEIEEECCVLSLIEAIAYAHERMRPGTQIVVSQPGRLWASYTYLDTARIRAWLFTPTGIFEEVRFQCCRSMGGSSASSVA